MVKSWKGIPRSMERAANALVKCEGWTLRDQTDFVIDCNLYKETIRCLKVAKKELAEKEFNKHLQRIDTVLNMVDRRSRV